MKSLSHVQLLATPPKMSQSIPGKPVFPALPRLSSRGSTHTTVARGTALWESVVGKPRGKATDSLIHANGSATVLLQLERKHESPPTSRGAPFALPSSRGGILSLRSRERIPGVPVASQEEALSTGKPRGGEHPTGRIGRVSKYSFPVLCN